MSQFTDTLRHHGQQSAPNGAQAHAPCPLGWPFLHNPVRPGWRWLLLIASSWFAGVPSVQARTFVVNQRHSASGNDQDGTEAHPLATIQRGAELAQPGDVVLVHGGTYRERVSPVRGGREGQPIVYQAAPGEQVVIKGSDVWNPVWQEQKATVTIFSAPLERGRFDQTGHHPYQTALAPSPPGRHLSLGQVFCNGQPLSEVEDIRALNEHPGSWRTDGTQIWLHLPVGIAHPSAALIELTVRDRIFAPHRRGLGYLHVIGFTMEHCANQFPDHFWQSHSPQAGAMGCRAGHHWLIERNTIRWAKSIGLDCGYEGRFDLEGLQPTPQQTGDHVIRNNHITDNGCCGIAGMRSLNTQIVGNVIERNNYLQHAAPEIGGIKLHHFLHGLIAGNLIRNNWAHGIWLDNSYDHATIRQNLLDRNCGNGIFVELGAGPLLVDHNIVANTRPGYHPQDPRGDGLYSHDASGITFAHNLVFGSHRFGAFHTKATTRAQAAVSQIQLVNNLFVNNHQGHLNLPYPGTHARDNRSDVNLFDRMAQGFVIHPWGGADRAQFRDHVARLLNRPPSTWQRVAVRCDLPEWQQLTNWDRQSNEGDSAVAELSEDGVLTLMLQGELPQLALPVPEVERDYFDRAIRHETAVVGPFQDRSARTRWRLWPREPVEVAPASAPGAATTN